MNTSTRNSSRPARYEAEELPGTPSPGLLGQGCLNVADPSYQNLLIIPALLQTAVLALLSAAVPMRATATSAVAAVSLTGGKTQITMDPSPREADKSRSVHVLAFTSSSELLLAESEGDFTMDEWDQVYETSRSACCGAGDSNGIHAVLETQQSGPDMRQFVRSAAESKVAADLYWK